MRSEAKNFCDQKVIVMDDVKYFTFSHSTLTGMKFLSLHPSEGHLSSVKLSMLTFISPNVGPKWSNSSRSNTKMTKQSFGPIWHRAIMQKKRWNGWNRKTSK
jgi:hypothetical protein